MKSFDPQSLNIPQVHGLLLGAVGPRPIALASTISKDGKPNLAPFSFFNVFSANPPIMIFSPARSGRTGDLKDTYYNVKEHAEVVVNIVNYDMVHQISVASSPFAPDVDEFVKSGLTPLASEKVKPFRVAEAPVQFECKVKEVIELGTEGGAGNLIVSEVVMIHVREDLLNDQLKIDQKKIDLVGRMGGNWYIRANDESMFEVEKPVTTLCIGYDNIPEDIRKSEILSANDLGFLAAVEELPDETSVNEHKLIELSELFLKYEDDAVSLEKELHSLAKALLANNKVEEAWKTLLAFND